MDGIFDFRLCSRGLNFWNSPKGNEKSTRDSGSRANDQERNISDRRKRGVREGELNEVLDRVTLSKSRSYTSREIPGT